MLKNKVVQNKSERDILLKQLQSRYIIMRDDNNNNGICRIYSYNVSNTSEICSELYNIQIILDYYETTLEQEIEGRKVKNVRYHECEIWYMIYSITSGLLIF